MNFPDNRIDTFLTQYLDTFQNISVTILYFILNGVLTIF